MVLFENVDFSIRRLKEFWKIQNTLIQNKNINRIKIIRYYSLTVTSSTGKYIYLR